MERKDLIQAVAQVQNMLLCPIDILSFCGWRDVTNAEIRAHLERYIARVQGETDAMVGRRTRKRGKGA